MAAELVTNLTNLATRMSTESKALRTLINGNVAGLSGLNTTAKTNLVSAINEVNAALSGAVGINDTATSTGSTWSSQKTSDSIVAAKNDILGGAGAAYDTLQELKDLLDVNTSADNAAIAAINTALGNRVRTDVANQALDATARANARTNIDVYSKAEIGDVTTDFVAIFEAGLV